MSRESLESLASLDRAALARALAGVARKDRSALQDVYRRTSRKLFGICLRILRERADAEDAMQDIYLTIWNRAGTFDPARGNPVTWLAALARNRAIDILRSSGRRPSEPIELAAEVADSGPDAEAALIEQGEDARMLDCIDRLAGRDATMIRTAFFEGVTYAELAERVSLPLGTVKSRIRRALLRLRDCLS